MNGTWMICFSDITAALSKCWAPILLTYKRPVGLVWTNTYGLRENSHYFGLKWHINISDKKGGTLFP